MPRLKKDAPPAGGAVTEPVREQIKKMSGSQSEQEMADALPTDTMQAPLPGMEDLTSTGRPRRPRGPNKPRGAPMEEVDPLMLDPRYKKAIERMRSAGISKTVKGGFAGAAVMTKDPDWKLDEEEGEEVDDFSYVVSKKYPLMDPSRHWISMILYFVALIGTLIFKRAAKMKAESWMKKLSEWFGGEEEELDAQEKENVKAASV